ncbi:putative clathrin assembly protein At4g40080 [Gastrolobium bilobum]|uniref:putative clathrin assembly protein At4g40080 n=1 Tax=Gastrolobium bilobum TaxID=150636 RepID=UPI002AB24132|nr:putative clathrin assembly protein At4g40080 [Gastrolobium bilobum]
MTKLTNLIGIIKDKASQSKAALLSKRTTLSLLRATSHDSFTPPTHKHLSTLLSSGDGSRATASAVVEVLMDRLQGTNSSAVALKCLIAVHHIIKHGSFILQDQLSVYPSTGGRNYLNLSNFRHNSNPVSWELSSWVRWFAQHIEQLLCTCRILGFFLGNSPSDRGERVSGLTNADLLTEFDSLVTLVEGICKRPDPDVSNNGNKLVDEIVNLVGEDWVVIETELSVRVSEFEERLGCLNFGEAIELVCCMKRLEECKERIMMMIIMMMLEVEQSLRLWDSAKEVKDKAGIEVYKEEGKVQKAVRKHMVSESDRFSGRVLNSQDLLRFPSGRLL